MEAPRESPTTPMRFRSARAAHSGDSVVNSSSRSIEEGNLLGPVDELHRAEQGIQQATQIFFAVGQVAAHMFRHNDDEAVGHQVFRQENKALFHVPKNRGR